MNDLDRLVARDAIRTLKARYCIAVDTKDAVLLASVLAPDAVADFSGALRDPQSGEEPSGGAITRPLRGREVIVRAVLRAVADQVTVHQCAEGDIVVEDMRSARATWPVTDRLKRTVASGIRDIVGYGFYHETYCRENGEWRIATIAMTRLRVDFEEAVSGEQGGQPCPSPAAAVRDRKSRPGPDG